MELLRDLLGELSAVDITDSDHQPERKVQEGEVVLGILPNQLKKLYVVLSKSIDKLEEECGKIDRMKLEILQMPDSRATDYELEVLQKHDLAHEWHKIIGLLFWHGVKRIFSSMGTTGLREGWQVVKLPPTLLVVELVPVEAEEYIDGEFTTDWQALSRNLKPDTPA